MNDNYQNQNGQQDGWSESKGSLNPTWEFDKLGPTVTGIYKEYKRDVGVNKSDIVVLEVTTHNGQEMFGVWCNARLKTLMSNPEIQIGMLLSITRLGRVQTKVAGRSYWDFKVLYRQAPQQVVFNQQQPQQFNPQPPVQQPQQFAPPVQQQTYAPPVQQPQQFNPQPPVQQPQQFAPPVQQPNFQPPVQQPVPQNGVPPIGNPNNPPF